MFERTHRFSTKTLLAACALGLAASSMSAQTGSSSSTPPAAASAAPAATLPAAPPISRFDIFTGYSYLGTHSTVKPDGVQYSSMNYGAIGSAAYFFNKYAGGQFEYYNSPGGTNDALSTFEVGPIFRYPMKDFTVFAHGLVGGARLGGASSVHGDPTYFVEPFTMGVGLTAGGGMDYDTPLFNHHLGIRLFQADYQYVHADFGPALSNGVAGGRANLNAARLSTGLLFHFGSIVPPPPVTYTCTASPASVYPGDPVTITGMAMNLNPKKTATYSWTTDGGKISGNSSTGNIDTTTAAPGTYTAKGHVEEGNKPGQMADCTASYTVKPFEPPTVSCSANPSTINPGDSSTITAQGVSPQNRPLTYSYSASSGSITGTGSTGTLATTGAAPGTITVTCNVTDDKGQTASSTTSVTITAPPPPPAPVTAALCAVKFDRDVKRPTRVDNEAKACLDDIALNMQRTSDAKIAVIGQTAAPEHATKAKAKRTSKYAAERAVNTKDYLVNEKGIDASRISVYTGVADEKGVETILIPAGAMLDTTGLTPVDESAVKAKPRNPAKATHHSKKKMTM